MWLRVTEQCKHTSHTKHLETCCLWWQHCSPTNCANLYRRHSAGHVQVSAITSPRLHQCHAVAAAHILGWVLQHQKCSYIQGEPSFMGDISQLLWNPQSHYHVHCSSVLIQTNSFHILTYYYSMIQCSITLQILPRSSCRSTKILLAFRMSPTTAYPAHLTRLDQKLR